MARIGLRARGRREASPSRATCSARAPGLDRRAGVYLASLPEPLRTGVVDAFADALAPAFWYLVPLLAAGFVLNFFLREVALSDVVGMVARGEAVAGPVRDRSTPTVTGAEGVAVGAAAVGALSPTTDGPQARRSRRRPTASRRLTGSLGA